MQTIIQPPAPPQAPPLVQIDHEPPHARRIHFRVQQILLSIITVGVTCWLWVIHPIAGLTAAFLAKHILVAILASGLTYPSVHESRD
jgi:hypothetical protein